MKASELESTKWFRELFTDVERELLQLRREQHDRHPALEAERERLEGCVRGWKQSLGNQHLDSDLRTELEEEVRQARARVREIEAALAEQDAADRVVKSVLDPQQVADRLGQLSDVLARNNPSLGNLVLSQYVDVIACDCDGRVVLRTCRLGPVAEAVEWFRGDETPVPGEKAGLQPHQTGRCNPRRRARLRVDGPGRPGRETRDLAHWAADPHRFAGLPESWFEEHVFQTPVKQSWAEEHAAEVARLRVAGMTVEKLGQHFGKTPPTIRSALRHAASAEEFAGRLPKKLQRARWHEDEQNVQSVVTMKAQGLGVPEIARRLGKSEPTIRKALEYAAGSARDEQDGDCESQTPPKSETGPGTA